MPEMLSAPYRSSDDAYELAAALLGKPWPSIPVRTLFLHREMLFALSPNAYRACLPAALAACLGTDEAHDKYGADLRESLVESLVVSADASADRRATTRARLAALDHVQRDVVRSVAVHLKDRWHVHRTDDVLLALDAISSG